MWQILPLAVAALQTANLAALDAWHERTASKLADALALVPCSFSDDSSVRSWEAPSQSSSVDWCSALSLSGPDGFSSRSITVWNAPSVEVPHLYLRLGVEAERVELEIDFRHRLASGYESKLPDGTYPPPSTREEFAAASVRASYDEKFFTVDARRWRDGVALLEGAAPAESPFNSALVEGRRQFGGPTMEPCFGPLQLSLQLPLAHLDAAAVACDEAAERWIAWMAGADEASWVNNRRIYDRDCLVRLAVLRANAAALGARLGAEDGLRIALADAGPQDMMGHNLMQEQGGFGSDPDEGRD